MPEATHYPAGGMCGACIMQDRNCSWLPFPDMPVVRRYADGTAAVRCIEFVEAGEGRPRLAGAVLPQSSRML